MSDGPFYGTFILSLSDLSDILNGKAEIVECKDVEIIKIEEMPNNPTCYRVHFKSNSFGYLISRGAVFPYIDFTLIGL